MRRIRIHGGLVVPEEGTVFERPQLAENRPDPNTILVWVAGIARPFPVSGDAMDAVEAYAHGDQIFPVVVANDIKLIDIPAGWAASRAAREMRAGPVATFPAPDGPIMYPDWKHEEAPVDERPFLVAPIPADPSVPDIDPEKLAAFERGDLYK